MRIRPSLTCLLVHCIIIIHIISCSTSGTVPGAVSDSVTSKAIIENKWLFTANYVIPQGGRSRPTNDLYTVSLTKKKLVVSLPYFGRAWGGGLLTNQRPLEFTSLDFTINTEKKKKGKWSITIKPKDYAEVQTLSFNFFESGSAILNITLTNRSAISFNGYVAAVKPK